ncbi:ubiquinone biosynthesis O-methyltransferase [Abditibacteriota bacterium]|nr:ubiquinone biosynthesis O-methyltransferase [Abditibacteriota bacterium]
MLLQLSTTHYPATDLGFLLAKNPVRAQEFSMSFGTARIFYPVATDENCTCALMLDVDPVALVRGKNSGEGLLSQYVNDRPYAATSFLSVTIAQVLRSAMSGVCKEKPELALTAIPLRAQLEGVPASPPLLEKLFAPLGYEVEATPVGPRHCRLVLRAMTKLSDLLSHLYVLIPVLDDNKHYFIGDDEVEKLLRRGAGWLEQHPERELIVARYLKKQKRLIRVALERLAPVEEGDETGDTVKDEEEQRAERPLSLHQIRLDTVARVLKEAGVKRVLDLGCGEGRLMRELLKDGQFEFVRGVDASHRALDNAADKLRFDRMPDRQKERVELLFGVLTYRDERYSGFDAAALVEVIEHLDPARLPALERVVWEFARPGMIVVTTPNRDYNSVWESLPAGSMRHRDHRFEWTRAEFESWAKSVADKFNYSVETSPLGPEHETLGAPSQMAIFRRG